MPFVFNERATEEIISIVRQHLGRILPAHYRRERKPLRQHPVYFQAKITTTVTPANDNIPGFGEAEIYRKLASGASYEMTKMYAEPQKVFINVPVPVHDGVWVNVKEDAWGDLWVEPDSFIKVFLTKTGGIGAASGGVSGVALCELQKFPATGPHLPIPSLDADSNQIELNVYNRSYTAIPESKEIHATLIDGKWVANWEDC